MSERTCPICGCMFEHVNPKVKYCSSLCAVEAARERARRAYDKKRVGPTGHSDEELYEMAQIAVCACRAVDALSMRQRMRLEILLDTEGEGDGQDAD